MRRVLAQHLDDAAPGLLTVVLLDEQRTDEDLGFLVTRRLAQRFVEGLERILEQLRIIAAQKTTGLADSDELGRRQHSSTVVGIDQTVVELLGALSIALTPGQLRQRDACGELVGTRRLRHLRPHLSGLLPAPPGLKCTALQVAEARQSVRLPCETLAEPLLGLRIATELDLDLSE